MKHAVCALAVMGALVIAGPAMAQLVNGQNSIDKPLPEAPIGTKAGGSPSSLQAPGEGPAVVGALKNAQDAKTMNRRVMPPPAPSYPPRNEPDE